MTHCTQKNNTCSTYFHLLRGENELYLALVLYLESWIADKCLDGYLSFGKKNDMESYTNSFFRNLGDRIYNENRLSDVIWALCKSSPEFMKLFLNFFFGESIAHESHIEIHREFASGNCRVDFWIKNEGITYIIEVKIGDTQHHFKDYRIAYPKAKKGYIANYDLPIHDDYITKTWVEFVKHSESIIDSRAHINAEELELIKGFITYLKTVCEILEIQKMTLNNLSSIRDFLLLSTKIISEPFYNDNDGQNHFKCNLNNQKYGCNDYTLGKWFTIHKNGKVFSSGNSWFGLSLSDDVIYFYLSGDGGNSEAFKALKQAHDVLTDNQYFLKPYVDITDPDAYNFELSEFYMGKINDSETTVDDQRKIITNFFRAVIIYVDGYIRTPKS